MQILKVPFGEKDDAKAMGARWNQTLKTWFVPDGVPVEPFAKWIERAFEPTEQLFVDLVPTTAWFSNLRSELSADEWKAVQKKTFKSAGHRCQACGGKGDAHPVECHERWEFDMESQIQRLVKTVALCPACHQSTHYGLARVRGLESEAREQLKRVNRWTDSELDAHVREAMDTYADRSDVEWTLDARSLLSFVDLSDKTREKIQSHASGLSERTVTDSQSEMIEVNIPRKGFSSYISHLFSGR